MTKEIIGMSAIVAIGCIGAWNADAADWTVSGFVRQEIAAKISDDSNMNNGAGNPFNGVAEPYTGLGPTPATFQPRPASAKINNTFNQFSTRLELNLDGRLTENWSAHVKLRGIVDEIGRVESAFRDVDLYEQPYAGSSHGATPLEVAGKDWMADLPIAYVDYNHGPLWLRLGNQQIAWGEAIFFRVSDQVNGLDLRRHSVLGVAAEEFSDSRVPSLGLRGSYRLNEGWELEGYTHRFQPTLLGNRDSPYSVIPSQFIVEEKTGYDASKDHWDVGAKLRGTFGDYGVSFFAIRRDNPDGVFKWTLAQGPTAIPGSAFSGAIDGSGVFNAQEFFSYAAHSRLDGLGTLESALNQFPIGANVGGLVAGCGAPNATPGSYRVDQASASCILDTFFGGGDLNGWIKREYLKENVFGGSVNHVFTGETDGLMDQLIGRFELSYTPNKQFTNPTLSSNYIQHNETQFAFVAEKYYKFGRDVPATYFVLQWMHKSASDIFGRALEGNDNTPGSRPGGIRGGSNYIALALQQPSPTLAWRFDFTALTDLKGGWLVQPGTRWKPNKDLQFDFYVNVLGSTSSSQTKTNFAQDLQYAREAFIRATYFF